MAVAVIAAVALMAGVPSSVRPESRWLLAIIGLLLLVLVVADPGRIDRPTILVRVLARLLLSLLATSAAASTALLVHVLVVGGDLTHSATRLLLVGNAIWISNNIVSLSSTGRWTGVGPRPARSTRPSIPTSHSRST
ncbi:MAG TPA: hypothetical protein VH476_07540 [Solirubrobacterales bacterium]